MSAKPKSPVTRQAPRWRASAAMRSSGADPRPRPRTSRASWPRLEMTPARERGRSLSIRKSKGKDQELGGQGMVGLGGDELLRVPQGGPDIGFSHPVFADDFRGGHAAGEGAENPLHGNAGAPDDGFTVLDGGIDDDAVGHGGSLSEGGGLSRGWRRS